MSEIVNVIKTSTPNDIILTCIFLFINLGMFIMGYMWGSK